VTVGFLVTHHYEFMLHKQLRDPYHHLLTHEDIPIRMCCQVLRNLQTYLVEEELKMMKADAECTFATLASFIYQLTATLVVERLSCLGTTEK